jgi:ABC-type Fe2+-enterobactin transport system substrate-binding protein
MTHLDLTSLTKQQLTALLWELKGTPAAHPIYQELRTRSPKVMIEFSDPDWERKTDEAIKQALGLAALSG